MVLIESVNGRKYVIHNTNFNILESRWTFDLIEFSNGELKEYKGIKETPKALENMIEGLRKGTFHPFEDNPIEKQLSDSKKSVPKSEEDFCKTDKELNRIPDVPTDLKDSGENYPQEEVKWKKYPENKPIKYTPNCIVWTEDEEIIAHVFWSLVDSQHNDSIWSRVKFYLSFDDLRKLKHEKY